jgi:hypothetical protein
LTSSRNLYRWIPAFARMTLDSIRSAATPLTQRMTLSSTRSGVA